MTDSWLQGEILDTLTSTGLPDNTLVIASADHGGDGHLARRTAPEELQRLRGDDPRPARVLEPPVVPKPEKSAALVSHVDFLPTLASLVNAPAAGRDSSTGDQPAQDYTVFTYDDYQSGQARISAA